MPAERTASVWSSTFVPTPSPLPDYGEEGYSVAWVDTEDGRVQVLVEGDRPMPGVRGRIAESTFGDEEVDVFIEDHS